MQNFNRLTRSPVFREHCRFVIRESTKITSIICLTSAIADSRCTIISTYLKVLIATQTNFFKAQAIVIFLLIGSHAILCNHRIDEIGCTSRWPCNAFNTAITFSLRAILAKIKTDFTRRSACGGLHFRARNHYKIDVASGNSYLPFDCRMIAWPGFWPNSRRSLPIQDYPMYRESR